jgi:acetyl-CoA carboxylase carboxyl transferase subunit beta
MGGVLASWASLGTLVLAEPKAMIGFTGGRVSKTVLKSGKLPDNWQTSEFQAEHGNIDMVVTRADLPKVISFCLDWTVCTSYETSWRTAHEAKSS